MIYSLTSLRLDKSCWLFWSVRGQWWVDYVEELCRLGSTDLSETLLEFVICSGSKGSVAKLVDLGTFDINLDQRANKRFPEVELPRFPSANSTLLIPLRQDFSSVGQPYFIFGNLPIPLEPRPKFGLRNNRGRSGFVPVGREIGID